MEKKEEIIYFNNGSYISRDDYNKVIKDFCEKLENVNPLTFEGKNIGIVSTVDNEINSMVVHLTTDEGKKIIEGVINQPLYISARKMGTILEDGAVDDTFPYNEFAIVNHKTLKLTENDLLEIGFTKINHFTITNSFIYNLERNRQLSIGSVGTPNEMLCICELDSNDERKITDLVVLHNYDYDGYLTKEKLVTLINCIGNSNKIK